jgi:hypothetical protein
MEETATRTPPTLLTLPGEIRSSIIGYTLTSRSGCLILELKRRDIGNPKSKETVPANAGETSIRLSILRACQDLYGKFEENLRSIYQAYAYSEPSPLIILEGNAKGLVDTERTTFSLALLRTCKQIYGECKLDIWGLHQIRLGNLLLSELNCKAHNYKLPVILPFTLIQDLELPFQVHDQFNSRNHTNALWSNISHWAKAGELRSITVKMLCQQPITPSFSVIDEQHFDILLSMRTLRVFRGDKVSAKIQKKLLLTKSMIRRIWNVSRNVGDFERTVSVLHNTFGGELWIGETLCWKDGVQMTSDWGGGKLIGDEDMRE